MFNTSLKNMQNEKSRTQMTTSAFKGFMKEACPRKKSENQQLESSEGTKETEK